MAKINLLEGKSIVVEPEEEQTELISSEQVAPPQDMQMQEPGQEQTEEPSMEHQPSYYKKPLWPFFAILGGVIVVGSIIYYLLTTQKPTKVSPKVPAPEEITKPEEPAPEVTEKEPTVMTVAEALKVQRAYSVAGARLLTQLFDALSDENMALSFFVYDKGTVSLELLVSSDNLLSTFNLNLRRKNPQLQFRVLDKSDFKLPNRTVRRVLLTGTFPAEGVGKTTGKDLELAQLKSEITKLVETQGLLVKELSISPAVAVTGGYLVPLSLKVYGRRDNVFHLVQNMLDNYRNMGFSRLVSAVKQLRELDDEYITMVFDIDLFTTELSVS
ncbi:hypothetical protein J7K19_03410 [bacterium]|nr:hypothetical protein [bacterium]